MNLGSTRVRQCMRRTSWFFVQAKQENRNVWWCLLGCTLLLRYHTNCSPRTPCLEWMSDNKMSWTHVLALEWAVVGGLFIVVFNMSEQGISKAFLPLKGCCSSPNGKLAARVLVWPQHWEFGVGGSHIFCGRGGEKGVFQHEGRDRVVTGKFSWIAGSGLLLVTGARTSLSQAPKWYTVSGLAL